MLQDLWSSINPSFQVKKNKIENQKQPESRAPFDILDAPHDGSNLTSIQRKTKLNQKQNNAPAGNRTRVCTVAGYYSTTRPLVLFFYNFKLTVFIYIDVRVKILFFFPLGSFMLKCHWGIKNEKTSVIEILPNPMKVWFRT